MTKVFVLQDTQKHNYIEAEKFGNIFFCSGSDILAAFGLSGSPRNEITMKEIFRALKEFREGDYLMISGNPIIIAISIHFLLMRFPKINILKWDNMRYQYDPLAISNEEIAALTK